VREITGATRVYLHLAHPSAHGRTPQVMNAEFARRGVDAVAVSADVAPGDLGGFAHGLRGWRNLAGLSVTMPHREALASHVDELAGPAALIGAVNVVRREPDGRLVAANTDGPGFVIGRREAGHELSSSRVLLAGAGGAGRAVAFAVAGAGATHLTIPGRRAGARHPGLRHRDPPGAHPATGRSGRPGLRPASGPAYAGRPGGPDPGVPRAERAPAGLVLHQTSSGQFRTSRPRRPAALMVSRARPAGAPD
jgi:hypothetical protein